MTTDSEEEWRLVPGFADYEVSNCGRVRSWRPKRGSGVRRDEPVILKQTRRPKGYMQVGLARDGLPRYNAKVHRLVALAFHGSPIPGLDTCCHNNGVPDDNRAENLRWDSQAGNVADKAIHGTGAKGSRINTARLVDSQVLAIRGALLAGESRASVARQYCVSWNAIHSIGSGASWGWLGSDAA